MISGRMGVANLVLACAATVLALALSLIPAAQLGGWRWVAVALMSVPALWCAAGVHRSALRHLAGCVSHPDLLASAATLVTYIWALATIQSAEAGQHIAVAVVTATLVVVAHFAAVRAGIHTSVPWRLVLGLLGLAAATLVGWWMASGPARGGSAAVAVMVAGCSASFLLAVPAAILLGTKRGTPLELRFGELAALHAAAGIDTIVLDKKRTVTTGDLTVVSVDALDPDHDRNMRWFAGALEHKADDPVGRAIAKLTKLGGVGGLANVEYRPGLGVSGAVDRHPVRVGNPDWIGFGTPNGVGTTVAVEVDGRPLGCITVADDIRPHAGEAVEELHRLSLDVILVSDDNPIDTAYVAEKVGIDTHFAEQCDDSRAEIVTKLQAAGCTVAMVGDHNGNAAALCAADLAISCGPVPDGTTRASLIVGSINASTVAAAIALSRATLATVRANRWIALVTTVAPAPFAAAGLINPTIAVLIAIAGTVVVASNSWRLRTPALHAHAD